MIECADCGRTIVQHDHRLGHAICSDCEQRHGPDIVAQCPEGFETPNEWKWALKTRGRCPQCDRRAQLDTMERHMFALQCSDCESEFYHTLDRNEISLV
jgi:ssDNA-binding Zn-finger/Zn-ribbon topoisomerase 1